MRHKILILIFIFSFCFSQKVLAQADAGGGGGKEDPLLAGTSANAWIVVGCTGFGFIMGLSTLSFVEDPGEEFLDTVKIGSAIGLILGVGVVGFLQATKGQELYEQGLGEQQASYRWRYRHKSNDFESPVSLKRGVARTKPAASQSLVLPFHFTF